MVLQDGFTDLYSDRMSEMPIAHHHCPCFHAVPRTKPGDLLLCSGNCGYPSFWHGCCPHCSFPGPGSYPQSFPPCNNYDGGYRQIPEWYHVRHPSGIYSMDSPEYMYEENAPRNYEGFESSNNGGKNVDAEEVKPDMKLIKENEELRKLVKEHSSVVSHLNRIVDVLEENLAAKQQPVRGKQASNGCQYAHEVYNQIEEEDEIYDGIDEREHIYDQFDQNLEEVMEFLVLVMCGLIVWGIVWFL